MRAITAEAGMSVSAANYHFGSKEALLAATIRRHVEPINERRLAELARTEAESAPDPPDVEAILRAFLFPSFEEPSERDSHREVVSRLHSDPPERVGRLKNELYTAMRERFCDALARALPGADRAQIEVGYQFCIGVMVHVIAGHHMPSAPTKELDPEETTQAIARYTSAGLRALVGDGGGGNG